MTTVDVTELDDRVAEEKQERGLLKIFENRYMKKWLIYDYYNRKESFKMYKKIIKSNN